MKGVIYQIKTADGLYVGSTTDFNQRKSQHKINISNENRKDYNMNLYQNIRKNNGVWDMTIHSIFNYDIKAELKIEENRIIKELNCNLNVRSAYRSKSDKQAEEREYYHKHKDKILSKIDKEKRAEYQREYRASRREITNAKQRAYYQKKKGL